MCLYKSQSAHKLVIRGASRAIGCGDKSGVTCQVERQRERGREGKKEAGREKKSTYL